MGRIFKSLDLSAKLLHDLVRLDDQTAQLVTIKPGDVFFFALDQDGQFQALKGEHDEAHWLVVEQMPSGELVSQLEPRAIERRVVEARAVIDSSLFNAAVDAGLSNNMTMQLANVFGWDIDFALDIRKGDRFSLIYEEIWRDGAFLRDGAILAARFVNRGDSFEAVRFDAGNGPDYFDLNGRPMRKAFLRAPLNFTRVTSNFNPKRFHPVTRRIRPHNGTDYGAAPGTPVRAAGDGTVIESTYNRANGNYVFVQHGNHIVTRYLHLTRRDVNKGDRVKQGETIGTVGSTGLATGPHLHYEFLVNGAHRDPRKVDLPPVEPLPEIERERFLAHSQPLIERLNRVDEQATLLASMNPQTCPDSDESC
jgi:murein DD-endopeptidase MepM/ murein hydrolase activator NlpD